MYSCKRTESRSKETLAMSISKKLNIKQFKIIYQLAEVEKLKLDKYIYYTR